MAQRIGNTKRALGALAIAAVLTTGTAPSGAQAFTADAPRVAGERHVNVAIEWDPTTPVNEREIWMAYLFTRAANVARESEHEQLPLGELTATFDEEVRARRVAVNTFRQLERAHPALSSVYFTDLDRVDSAGFLREYVWRYFRTESWTTAPRSLRLTEFDTWRRTHLQHHVPRTHGGIALRLAAN